MKKLILALTLFIGLNVSGQQVMKLTSLASGTVSNIYSLPCILDNIYVSNATTNAATLYFFDARTATTNYSQAATVYYSSYLTNYNVVFTNQTGVVLTNTYSGIFTYPTVVALSTNANRNAILTVIVPGNSTLNKDVKIQAVLGISAVADADLTLITTSRSTY